MVWAHNSHIGNAAFTEMGQVRGEHNIGQLARQRFGDEAALIGFCTDRGTVAAASDWNGPMEIKRVSPRGTIRLKAVRATPASPPSCSRWAPAEAVRRAALAEPLLERAIGVIYRPETELLSHYFQAELSHQFDAWIWLTRAKWLRRGRRTRKALTRPIPSVSRAPKSQKHLCFILFLLPTIAFL